MFLPTRPSHQTPVRLREVVYTLSPFEQSVMNGLFKDLSYTV